MVLFTVSKPVLTPFSLSIAFLTQNNGVSTSSFLVQAQAGTEPFEGMYILQAL